MDASVSPGLDFGAEGSAVAAVAEAHRLAYGHLVNPAFAAETSLIDPLPHQRIAVYEQMLRQAPLRFLLADDAGAGKTIMTGLYVREMLSRRLIRRVLIVPPAGLVGNWEREMRTLFRLPFRIAGGADARAGNPFLAPGGDLVIASIDTLAGARSFRRLADPATPAYDLVVFDEAHKLAARREPDFRVRKTDRYRLAEALAGAAADDNASAGNGTSGSDRAGGARWTLPWSARHLLLLTATPHMGKDDPYYFLWRLLLPDTLSTAAAFDRFPPESRRNHFLRRTKEEMVRFDGAPLYPQRRCDTLSYALAQGPGSEQELYDATTDYIRYYYNRARVLNRSAARLAMSVFQRRLASSTYALMRSFERRHEKLAALIAQIREGRLSEEQLARGQRRLDGLDDEFETRTADEDAPAGADGAERHEGFEERALGATVAVNLGELEAERLKVAALLDHARARLAAGDESKFDTLREVLRDSRFGGEKLIVFTEHRDTAQFLVRRLEGLGFAGRVALIHGGLPYRERDRQVAFFRRPAAEGGADYLVATDAAGEGINLQFCWLMVNYDIPWNPARLEQRMGRIHRYGQAHDPVVIVNLVAGGTREGRVMRTLLDKLEAIRRQLRSDKVFDVVGRLFQGVSVRDFLVQAVTEDDAGAAARLEGRLTGEQVRALAQRERTLYGDGGEVRGRLTELAGEAEREHYRRLLPGYVRRFVAQAAPLLDLRIEGDPERTFALAPRRAGAADALLPGLEAYPEAARGRLTVYRPADRERAVWLHPGEPVFDGLAAAVVSRCGAEALRGAVFVDPHATEAYLFHVGVVTAEQRVESSATAGAAAGDGAGDGVGAGTPPARLLESRLFGLRQTGAGAPEESPVERLLLLRGAPGFAPSRAPLASQARGLVQAAARFARGEVAERLADAHRRRLAAALPARVEFANRGFDFRAAELAAARAALTARARAGSARAQEELARVKQRQRSLAAARARRLAELHAEADAVHAGEVEFLAHALVVPAHEPEEAERFDAGVEAIAVQVAAAYEEHAGAGVRDVSRPEAARRAGLPDWPGFDLLSRRPGGERRCIEVKGRAGGGGVEVSDNEWAKACNLGAEYWLYVVYDCATPARACTASATPSPSSSSAAANRSPTPSLEVLYYRPRSNDPPPDAHGNETAMRDLPPRLNLEFNPFEPAGAGAPPGTTPLIPGPLKSRVQELLDRLGAGDGIKVVVIVGGYGVGKTCLLEWLRDEALPSRRIMPFYFDNPGVHFYSLANRLLNTLGRKDFAKFIWELARPYLSPDGEIPPHLSYENYLDIKSIPRNDEHRVGPDLRKAIMQAGVTDDEEISHCLARFVTKTKWDPYYDYRDFLPRNGGHRVREPDDTPYFGAILRTIAAGTGTDAIAFLIDEFEQMGLERRLTRRTILDYRSTLTRLINLAHGGHPDLWLFLSMTPETYATTVDLEPAIAERFFGRARIDVAPLSQDAAVAIVKSRVERARAAATGSSDSLFPFGEELPFGPSTYSNPRRLVKTCSFAISQADPNTPVPFRDSYLKEIERSIYPPETENG